MASVIQPGMASEIEIIGKASLLRPKRIDQAEMLDLNAGSLDDVRANLREMWRINQWLGGLGALTTHLLPMLAGKSQSSVLDLGTGGAEIPVFLTKWAAKQGIQLQVLGVDWSARNLIAAGENIAGNTAIQLLRADALNLPLAESSIDVVISSLFLHHFAPHEVITLLRKAFQASRRGIVMSDLVRGYLPLMAFKLITPIFARNWLTKHDGVVSIYRAYTPDELLRLAQAAGLTHARVHTHFPWRMTLIAEKSR